MNSDKCHVFTTELIPARLNHKYDGNDKNSGKRDKANFVLPQFALGQDPQHGIDQQHTN